MTYALGARAVLSPVHRLCRVTISYFVDKGYRALGSVVESGLLGSGGHNPRRFDSYRTCCTAALHSASEMAKSIRPAVLAKFANVFLVGRPAASHMPNFRMQPSAARSLRRVIRALDALRGRHCL